MKLELTPSQRQRLIELGAGDDLGDSVFESEAEREAHFKVLQNRLAEANRERLARLRDETHRPALRRVEAALVETLNVAGFVEVTTPATLAKGMLGKMGIDESHPLYRQIYWLDDRLCLRPMLAPNLYHLLARLGRLWRCPIRLFEVGPCFRKESKGTRHLSEFTMLNVVEMGISGPPEERLEQITALVMGAVGLPYDLESEESEVYGRTTDVLVGGVEVASGTTGPHPLDVNWEIAENWAGMGFGLERLVMLKEGFPNIRRVGRSLIYLDGARINV